MLLRNQKGLHFLQAQGHKKVMTLSPKPRVRKNSYPYQTQIQQAFGILRFETAEIEGRGTRLQPLLDRGFTGLTAPAVRDTKLREEKQKPQKWQFSIHKGLEFCGLKPQNLRTQI